jgi:hypothetical protein
MDYAEAEAFVDRWANGWNTHDVEAILTHFTDDVVFTSPIAIQLLGGDGVIRGKDALRQYWTEGIRRVPDLHFEVLGFYVGVSILVINYRNQKGGLVSEVLSFDGPRVREGHGTYLGNDTNPAGAAPAAR